MKTRKAARKGNGSAKKSPAEKYVESQLRLMKKYGALDHLSQRDYKALVNKVARATVG